MAYRTLVQQTMHYFARPHGALPEGPVGGVAAWRGEELASRTGRWREQLEGAAIEELEEAIACQRQSGLPLGETTREHFPLPGMRDALARWRSAITDGIGLALIRGMPVDRWSREDAERCFWGLGLHLGIPGAQNPQGDLLGHVTDTGADPDDPTVRQYRTAVEIPFHCDAADAVGLLCLRPAVEGGKSRVVSSVAVFNELWRRSPEHARRLFEPFLLDTHAEGGMRAIAVPPCRYADGQLRTFYHSSYFRSFERHEGLPRLDDASRAALDAYDAIADEPGMSLEMELRQGDIQLVSNHVLLHARGAYVDDPANKRHLLRLWLSMPRPRSWRARASSARSWLGFVSAVARARLSRS